MAELPESLHITPLDQATAQQEADSLLPIMGLVDPAIATPKYLLGTQRADGSPLHAKWNHSFVLRDGERPIGVILGYERPADSNPLFHDTELHLGVLALAREQQGRGYGAAMLKYFIDTGNGANYKELSGPIDNIGLAVDDKKLGPLKMYEEFGFSEVGREQRGDHLMHIMRAKPADLVHSDRYIRTPIIRSDS